MGKKIKKFASCTKITFGHSYWAYKQIIQDPIYLEWLPVTKRTGIDGESLEICTILIDLLILLKIGV